MAGRSDSALVVLENTTEAMHGRSRSSTKMAGILVAGQRGTSGCMRGVCRYPRWVSILCSMFEGFFVGMLLLVGESVMSTKYYMCACDIFFPRSHDTAGVSTFLGQTFLTDQPLLKCGRSVLYGSVTSTVALRLAQQKCWWACANECLGSPVSGDDG